MRRPVKIAVIVGVFLLVWGATVHAQPQWHVDRATVTFEIKNAGFPVHGSFAGLEAELHFDPDRPERSSIVASIDSATVDTGIDLRNRHLRKREYFDVAQYPLIRMKSLRLEKKGPEAFSGTFTLKLKGTQREITMPFTFSRQAAGATLAGEFIIDRLDFAIGEESLILADDVLVRISVDISPAG